MTTDRVFVLTVFVTVVAFVAGWIVGRYWPRKTFVHVGPATLRWDDKPTPEQERQVLDAIERAARRGRHA